MNVAQLDDMWVTFNVREDFLKYCTLGGEITAYIPALEKNATFKVKAVPVERTDGLRPGMSAIIEK